MERFLFAFVSVVALATIAFAVRDKSFQERAEIYSRK